MRDYTNPTFFTDMFSSFINDVDAFESPEEKSIAMNTWLDEMLAGSTDRADVIRSFVKALKGTEGMNKSEIYRDLVNHSVFKSVILKQIALFRKEIINAYRLELENPVDMGIDDVEEVAEISLNGLREKAFDEILKEAAKHMDGRLLHEYLMMVKDGLEESLNREEINMYKDYAMSGELIEKFLDKNAR